MGEPENKKKFNLDPQKFLSLGNYHIFMTLCKRTVESEMAKQHVFGSVNELSKIGERFCHTQWMENVEDENIKVEELRLKSIEYELYLKGLRERLKNKSVGQKTLI